jgi:hypothetical protein
MPAAGVNGFAWLYAPLPVADAVPSSVPVGQGDGALAARTYLMWIVPVAPGEALASVAVKLELASCKPVVAVEGALMEMVGVHLVATTFVDVMEGLQRELRSLFEASPLKCTHHQYVFPAATVAAPLEW